MPAACALLGGLALAFAQWLVFFHAPVEASLGLPQKIFYVHLPLAWWALISFFLLFLASIAYLASKKPGMDDYCEASAELGLLFACLALGTGMIWAKKSWGAWWTWDPRLTTTLIMCFIYAAYLIFRRLRLPPGKARRISAIIGIVAFLDVPFVFLSARVFRSIHPAVFASEGGGLEPEMRQAAIFCALALGLLWLGLLLFRARQLAAQRRLEELAWGRAGQEEWD